MLQPVSVDMDSDPLLPHDGAARSGPMFDIENVKILFTIQQKNYTS